MSGDGLHDVRLLSHFSLVCSLSHPISPHSQLSPRLCSIFSLSNLPASHLWFLFPVWLSTSPLCQYHTAKPSTPDGTSLEHNDAHLFFSHSYPIIHWKLTRSVHRFTLAPQSVPAIGLGSKIIIMDGNHIREKNKTDWWSLILNSQRPFFSLHKRATGPCYVSVDDIMSLFLAQPMTAWLVKCFNFLTPHVRLTLPACSETGRETHLAAM